jgi:hypothetical protein
MDLQLLNPDRALIFRITHIENLPWILDNGLHARNSATFDPNYRSIGNAELIDRRSRRAVPVSPGGVLADYVPFYFTPRTPMLLNIKTGHGVDPIPMEDIVMIVTSLHRLAEGDIPFVLTDRHAYLRAANYTNDLRGLDLIPWRQLQESDFKRSEGDPSRIERYQAEALVHRHLPLNCIIGMACYDEPSRRRIEAELTRRQLEMRLVADPHRYFE